MTRLLGGLLSFVDRQYRTLELAMSGRLDSNQRPPSLTRVTIVLSSNVNSPSGLPDGGRRSAHRLPIRRGRFEWLALLKCSQAALEIGFCHRRLGSGTDTNF